MKDLKNYKLWMIKAATELTLTELRVFIVWYDDSPDFSAGASILHERLPRISRRNIWRAMQGLEKKGFFKRNGKFKSVGTGKPIPQYDLGQLHSAAVEKISPDLTWLNASVQIPAGTKCFSMDTQMRLYRSANASVGKHNQLINPLKTKLINSNNFLNSKKEPKKKNPINPLLKNETELDQLAEDQTKDGNPRIGSKTKLSAEIEELVQKLKFIIANDKTKASDPKYLDNAVTAQKKLDKNTGGKKFDEKDIAWIDRVYKFNQKKSAKSTKPKAEPDFLNMPNTFKKNGAIGNPIDDERIEIDLFAELGITEAEAAAMSEHQT